jgi:hypothetical protein
VRDGKIDSPAGDVLVCSSTLGPTPDEMDRTAVGDDRPLEHSIFKESDAGAHVHAALDVDAGDDVVADGCAAHYQHTTAR